MGDLMLSTMTWSVNVSWFLADNVITSSLSSSRHQTFRGEQTRADFIQRNAEIDEKKNKKTEEPNELQLLLYCTETEITSFKRAVIQALVPIFSFATLNKYILFIQYIVYLSKQLWAFLIIIPVLDNALNNLSSGLMQS